MDYTTNVRKRTGVAKKRAKNKSFHIVSQKKLLTLRTEKGMVTFFLLVAINNT